MSLMVVITMWDHIIFWFELKTKEQNLIILNYYWVEAGYIPIFLETFGNKSSYFELRVEEKKSSGRGK